MKSFFTSILLALIITTSYCQNPSEDFLGSWYTYGLNHRFSERFSITPYGEFRFYEPSSNYNLAFFSLRGNYHFKGNQSVGLGYAYLDIDTVFEFDNEPNIKEHRILEQYIFKHKWGSFKVQHRLKMEHRFLQFSTRNDMQHRLRYCLSFRYDISKTFFAVVTEEPFVNFQDQAFHENRFYAGLGVNIVKNAKIQFGYLKQHIRKNNLNRIRVGVSFQTDFRKQNTKQVL